MITAPSCCAKTNSQEQHPIAKGHGVARMNACFSESCYYNFCVKKTEREKEMERTKVVPNDHNDDVRDIAQTLMDYQQRKTLNFSKKNVGRVV